MSRFNFRLQKVLDLKEQSAQIAATQLAMAQVRADEARDACDALAAIRNAGGAHMLAAHGSSTTAGQLQNISYLLERLDQRMDQAGVLADAAMDGVTVAKSDLMHAHQEKRALDRLRERRLGDWKQINIQSDLHQMDAAALSQFTRRNPQLSDET